MRERERGDLAASLGSMSATAHQLDLAAMGLRPGEGRRIALTTALEAVQLGGERYAPEPPAAEVQLEVSRMVGSGYALRLQFRAALSGPCMRCLQRATVEMEIDAREVDLPGGGDELDSPYMSGQTLDLHAWAHDALVLGAPAKILCTPGCRGLCPECAANLNEAGNEHRHERRRDARWAALENLKLE